MTLTWNRILSGLLAIGYVIGGFAAGGGEHGFMALLFVILPLACIWFSEPMGRFTGPAGSIGITASSPGIIICAVGWLVLALPLLMMLL
jgi:hypothetical protein